LKNVTNNSNTYLSAYFFRVKHTFVSRQRLCRQLPDKLRECIQQWQPSLKLNNMQIIHVCRRR